LSGLQPVLSECGFAYEGHLNFLIDLEQPEDTIWRRINKSGRQSVRTSGNKGVTIEEVTDRQQIAVVYRFLQQVYARVRVPLANATLFEAALDVLAPQGMFKGFLAGVDGHAIGTCLFLMYNKRSVTWWYGGTDRAFSNYCPMEALIWHALKWGQAHGFRVFDLGGAGRPDQDYGPRQFKSKFGGTLVNYGRNTCVHAPTRLKISQVGYQLMRKFL